MTPIDTDFPAKFHRPPPSQRLRHVDMSPTAFMRLVALWSGGVLALLVLCIALRLYG